MTPLQWGLVGAGALLALALAVVVAHLQAFMRTHVRLRLTWAEYFYVAATWARAEWAHRFSKRHVGADAAPLAGRDPVTPAWLTSVLERGNYLRAGTSVSSVKVQGLDNNRGLRGVMLAVDVEYAGASPAAGAKDASGGLLNPTKLVMKTVLFQHAAHRYDMMIAKNHREAMYYNSELERVHRLSGGVRVVHAASNPATGDSVILMEDIRASRPGTLGTNFYFGNQCWGIPPEIKAAMAPRTAADLLRVFFRRAADIHAPYWDDRHLLLASPQLAWLKGRDWYNGEGRMAWSVGVAATRGSWEFAKTWRSEAALPRALRAIIDASLDATSWEALQARLADKSIPVSLSHGDFHASNSLWLPPADASGGPAKPDGDDGTLFLVDWSEAGVWEPCTELGQMVISDVQPAVRRAHEKELFSLYVNRLKAAPGSRVPADFTPERALQLYARGGPERWVFFLGIMAAMKVLPDAAMAYFSNQFLAFVEDHGAHAPARGPGGVPAYPLGSLATLGMVHGQ